jgi:iron complex outermembrane receptor protein
LKGIESIIYGFEPNMKLNLKYFNFLSNASICRGLDLENNMPVAYIPPDLIRFQIEKNIKFLNNTFEVILASKQDKLGEFETSTNGYQLLNYKCSYTISKNENIHQFIFQVTNILNETYYNHLSKIKMIMPEPGVGANLNYTVNF